ncbi:MAG: hypothetical protein KJ063_11540 [Anaerolineae bacterium]|nr:hypothetical protein [Anaerolineae bacterium]
MNTWNPGVSDIVLLARPQPFANLPANTPQPYYRRVMAYERGDPNGQFSARLLIWYEPCQSPPNCFTGQ